MSSSLNAPRRGLPRWPVWFLRLTLTLTAALLFGEAVLAGQFMAGTYPALALHSTLSTVAFTAGVVAVIAAVLLRVRGRGPGWPIPATVGLLVVVTAQTLAGYMALVALHVPLGVALILLSATLTVWAWLR